MPTLTQLANGTSSPVTTDLAISNPVVEPLDGPSTVDQVFDHFPEEVYQQGKDSHLYRLLTALGGDAGAGLIKAQAYALRLQYEAEFMNFQVLDSFYSAQFRFNRLHNEVYPTLDPETDVLTPEQWDEVLNADQAYRQRAMDFWTATRSGNSPAGLQLMATAGIGLDCELVENYIWLFDQYSDSPLGVDHLGTTASPNEFIIIPRFTNSSDAASFEYTQNHPVEYITSPPSLPASRPALGGTPASVSVSVGSTPVPALLPQYERNAIDLLDRLRPTGTLGSITVDSTRYIEISMSHSDLWASSQRTQVNRLVTGQPDVAWPPTDPSKAYFIESGVENEAGYFYGSARELPVIFLTIENIHAYIDTALEDPTYLTKDFFTGSIPPFTYYKSEHVGFFSATTTALYPFLNGVSSSQSYEALNAVALHETPLILEGRAT